jgi:hypothetical protein
LWSDGLAGRADGFTWVCSQFADDGTHPSATGRATVADSLLAFFRADDTTAPWYRANPLDVASPNSTATDVDLRASPSPARRDATVSFTFRAEAAWRLELFDAAGRRVRAFRGDGRGATTVRWDTRDADARVVRPGVYAARLTAGARVATRHVVVVVER